jgi:pilus assembly protein CpaC
MLSKRLMAICIGALGLVLGSAASYGQTSAASPSYKIRDDRNEVALFERFSMFIEHTAKIRKVMDFDAEVLTVQTVEGNPNQFRIYALKSGVTSISVVDEFGKTFTIEVLVRGDVRHLESFIRRLYPDDTITIEEISDTAVRLDGWVSRPEAVSEIQAIAEQFYAEVLNHMKTGGVQQIMLKCTVLEVQRSKLRRLGMNFTMIRPDGYLVTTPGPITPITGITAGGAGTTITQNGFGSSSVTWGLTRPNGIFQGFIQAMVEEGLFKTHATPMIVTHNGRPANFLSGGETPVPVTAGLGAVGIEFREFGIQLNTVPVILGNGRVRLEVEAVVRDQDFSNTVTIGGTTTTAFRTNSANTQVEMNFGEALVIAGLVSKRGAATTQKVPFFGELPYVGAAFSRKQYTESESELMILVTPELVAPMPAGQLPSVGPGLQTDIPVDRELYFHGLLEVPKFGDECAHCTNCLPGATHCQDPNCPTCRGNGENCVPGTAKVAPSGKATIAPAAQSRPVPSGESSKGSKPVAPASRRTSSRSGLISPTMR